MRFQSLIRTFATAAAVCTTMAALPVQAATFTFSDPNCDSFAFDVALQALSCVVSSAPICSVQGPTTATNGNPVTLTAQCSGNPISNQYQWTGTGCASATGASCTTAGPGNNQQLGFTVAGTNSIGPGAASPLRNVTWSATAPPAPSGCTVTLNPTNSNLTSAGSPVSLTGSCTTVAATNWTWTKAVGGAAAGAFGDTSGGPQADSLPPNATSSPITYTFKATPFNGATQGTTITKTYTVAGTTVTSGTNFCPNYSNVIGMDVSGKPTDALGFLSTTAGGFLANGVWVGTYTIGNPIPPAVLNATNGIASLAEYQGSAQRRLMTLSAAKCDFRTVDPTGANGPLLSTDSATGHPQLTYGLAGNGPPKLLSGKTYYFNVMNIGTDGLQLPPNASSYNFFFTVTRPK